jgi:hypothetical protein
MALTSFFHAKDFSTFLLQYNRILNQFKFRGFKPVVGIKGGPVIYSDRYYRWSVDAVVPFGGLLYSLNKRIALTAQAGVVISFGQTVQRLDYGEIGHYKQILPEIKTGLVYNFGNQ